MYVSKSKKRELASFIKIEMKQGGAVEYDNYCIFLKGHLKKLLKED